MRGNCTPDQNWTHLCAVSKLFTFFFFFFQDKCLSWTKWSEKLKIGIKILVGSVVLEVLIIKYKILFWSITQEPTRASVLHKARISVDSCGDVDGMIVERKGRLWRLQQWNVFFDVFVFAFKEKHMRPVVTKWATSRQGTEGGMAHWTFQKSIENKGIWQGENSFGPQIRQQPWHVIYHFEPSHISEMDFCDLSLILWEQVSYCLYTCWF